MGSEKVFENIYRDKVVLVTGHTGFKGAWLSIWLVKLGAHVVGYSLKPPTVPSLFESSGLANQLRDIRGDIRDTEKITGVIRETRPDFIFHLAAAPLLLESYENPIETFDVNVMGTLSVLEAVRRLDWECSIVVVSTDKCYENREWEYGYRETDPLGGHDPYSASKAAMEIALGSFRESFFASSCEGNCGVRLASARAGNVVGGGDWAANRIVPDAMRALHSKKALIVRSPDAIRPWQHVLEPLSGYLALGSALCRDGGEDFATSWNFGPDTSRMYRVAELVDALISGWGSGNWITNSSPNGHHEATMLRLSIDKASLRLGWRPVWSFEETVTRTVNWYSSYLADPEDQPATRDLCIADISAYESAACKKGIAWAQQAIGAAVGY
jgi:CDP-glucose 4,6-dehydratase